MEKQKIKLIENMPFNLSSRVNLLLTYGGRKPVSVASLRPLAFNWPVNIDNLDNIHYNLESDRLRVARNNLDELGLPYNEHREFDLHYDEMSRNVHATYDEMDFIVANSKENLQKFVAADLKSDHRLMGKLFGIPESAVKAFITGTVGTHEKPQGPLGFFVQWEPSKDNYQSELRHAHRNDLFVQKHSPHLYQEIKRYFPG